MSRPVNDDTDDLDAATRRDLIAEAFHTFGERAARALARQLRIPFETCREAIERLRYRLQ